MYKILTYIFKLLVFCGSENWDQSVLMSGPTNLKSRQTRKKYVQD